MPARAGCDRGCPASLLGIETQRVILFGKKCNLYHIYEAVQTNENNMETAQLQYGLRLSTESRQRATSLLPSAYHELSRHMSIELSCKMTA
jgi:hypothetical protein